MAPSMKRTMTGIALAVFCTLTCLLGLSSTQAFADNPAAELPRDAQLIYETETVTLKNMPALGLTLNPNPSEDGSDRYWSFPVNGIKFEFYNATLQRIEGVYTVKDGVLPDI